MPTARSRLGALGDGVAGDYLEAKGYEIVATNYRCQWGEVDIIARDGDCLAFVEVRTRRSQEFGAPEESLSSRKREKLVATVDTYIQGCSTPPEEWRIDLVGVHVDGRGAVVRVQHIQDAIELG